jgi:hypothetical protein
MIVFKKFVIDQAESSSQFYVLRQFNYYSPIYAPGLQSSLFPRVFYDKRCGFIRVFLRTCYILRPSKYTSGCK